jgi:hypothetical protein
MIVLQHINNNNIVTVVPTYTHKLIAKCIGNRPETALQLRTNDDIPSKMQKVQSAAKPNQRDICENSKPKTSQKFFLQIQHSLLKKTDKNNSPREQRPQNSNNEQDLRVIKGTLIKTINLHIRQATSVGKKGNDEQEQGKKIIANTGKNENSSGEGKSASTFQSESKLVKQKINFKKLDSCQGAAKQLFTIDLRKPKQVFKGNVPMSSRIPGKIEVISTPNIRNSSASKNLEYFEFQKVQSQEKINNIKSPQNTARLLTTLKIKDPAFRSSASLLKANQKVNVQDRNFQRPTSSNK